MLPNSVGFFLFSTFFLWQCQNGYLLRKTVDFTTLAHLFHCCIRDLEAHIYIEVSKSTHFRMFQKFTVHKFIHIFFFQPAAICLHNFIWNLILEVHFLLCKASLLLACFIRVFPVPMGLVTALCWLSAFFFLNCRYTLVTTVLSAACFNTWYYKSANILFYCYYPPKQFLVGVCIDTGKEHKKVLISYIAFTSGK